MEVKRAGIRQLATHLHTLCIIKIIIKAELGHKCATKLSLMPKAINEHKMPRSMT